MENAMYQIQVETHSHTIVSNHAYSTLQENIKATKDAGMKGLCMTNHAPAIPDAPPEVHFTCLKYLPGEIDGIRFFKGAEANIIDYNGTLDLGNTVLAMLDWVIASIHGPCLKPGSVEEITNTYLQVLCNPYVHCLGHIGQMNYLCHWETVVKAAKEQNKIIELNNHSLEGIRQDSKELCTNVAALCKKHGCRVAVSSDAHYSGCIGNYKLVMEMLKEVDFPKELIVNSTLEGFTAYLKEAKLKF